MLFLNLTVRRSHLVSDSLNEVSGGVLHIFYLNVSKKIAASSFCRYSHISAHLARGSTLSSVYGIKNHFQMLKLPLPQYVLFILTNVTMDRSPECWPGFRLCHVNFAKIRSHGNNMISRKNWKWPSLGSQVWTWAGWLKSGFYYSSGKYSNPNMVRIMWFTS